MHKSDLKVLELLFEAEIGGNLPCQINRKRLPHLEATGYVQKVTAVWGDRYKFTVEGWELTPKGHMAYCEHAAAEPTKE